MKQTTNTTLLSKFKLTLFILMAVIIFSCTNSPTPTALSKPISESEVIAFQNSFGVSQNSIVNTIKNNGNTEVAAKNHIESFYGLNEGKVMFAHGNVEKQSVRSTFEGLLSYLIGNNSNFPNDAGIVNTQRTISGWKNAGIINDDNIAIAMGQVRSKNSNGEQFLQNYTMCIKRNDTGVLKLISHKVSNPCE